MSHKTDFGQFISEQKRKKKLQSQELAKKLGISIPYLSQLEHGKRQCPDVSLLKKMSEVFDLTLEERNILYDLYAEASGQLSPDIVEYLQANKIVIKVIRVAYDVSATDKDWELFMNFLKNEQ